MSLRFLADHCISNLIVQTIQKLGYKVDRLKDHIPLDSANAVVITKAIELDAIP